MFPIRNTTDHQGKLNARSWILQNLDIFHCTGSRAQLKINVKTREYFSILVAVIFERRTLEGRRHCNFRRGGRNEIDQEERNNAHGTDGRGQSFEQLPTIVSQHEYLRGSPSVVESGGDQPLRTSRKVHLHPAAPVEVNTTIVSDQRVHDVRLWHKADMPVASLDVSVRG